MKKKSLLAIMLIALVLTLGLMVSCQPDEPEFSIFGTWKSTVSKMGTTTVTTYTLNSDGTFTGSVTKNGSPYEAYEGYYSLNNGYLIANLNTAGYISQYTNDYSNYFFANTDILDDPANIATVGNAGAPASAPDNGDFMPFDKAATTYTFAYENANYAIRFEYTPSALSAALAYVDYKEMEAQKDTDGSILAKIEEEGRYNNAVWIDDTVSYGGKQLAFRCYTEVPSLLRMTTKYQVVDNDHIKIAASGEYETFTRQ